MKQGVKAPSWLSKSSGERSGRQKVSMKIPSPPVPFPEVPFPMAR